MKNWMAAFAALSALSFPLTADEIRLKNGRILEGVARDQGDKVVVEVDGGTITLGRDQIQSITHSSGPLDELEERSRSAKDAESKHQLAVWAEQHGLPAKARELHRQVLELNPDHEGARRTLGYTLYDGKWMTEDEVMAAKGMVRYQGRWVTPEEQVKLMEAEVKLRAAQLRLQRMQEEAENPKRAEPAPRAPEPGAVDLYRRTVSGTSWVPVPWWGQLPWSPYRYSGVTAFPPPPETPWPLPLSGVPQQLPLGGVPQQMPLLPQQHSGPGP
jgi:hypothetical protein